MIKERGGVCIYSESQTRPPEKTFVSTRLTSVSACCVLALLLWSGHSRQPQREELAQTLCEGACEQPRARVMEVASWCAGKQYQQGK